MVYDFKQKKIMVIAQVHSKILGINSTLEWCFLNKFSKINGYTYYKSDYFSQYLESSIRFWCHKLILIIFQMSRLFYANISNTFLMMCFVKSIFVSLFSYIRKKKYVCYVKNAVSQSVSRKLMLDTETTSNCDLHLKLSKSDQNKIQEVNKLLSM